MPIAILLAAIILGGFYYAAVVYKQQSIERQEQNAQNEKIEQDKKTALYNCIAEVDNQWASYIESVKGTSLANQFVHGITPAQQAELDNCNNEYK